MNPSESPGVDVCPQGPAAPARPRRRKRVRNQSPAIAARGEDIWDWRWQMRRRVRTARELERRLPGLPDAEAVDRVAKKYPMAISPYYLSLVEEPSPEDPIYRQCVPQLEELAPSQFGVPDPLHEQQHSPTPGLVHRYPDRALSVVSSICPMYCRHCTRKRMAGVKETFLSPDALAQQVEYLRAHPEIDDVIVSGGDPLAMSTSRLEKILKGLRSVPSVQVIRIGTRAPVTLPMRITDELCSAIAKHHPVWICTHFNHPREVTEDAAAACDKLLRAGMPVLNQTVLLRGVNDDADTLKKLFKSLIAIRVRPYYLFQCDLVQGVEHFRTPLAFGIEIMDRLRGHISGLACPQFVVDAPDGAGKIPVAPNNVAAFTSTETVLRSFEGRLVACPEPADLVGKMAAL